MERTNISRNVISISELWDEGKYNEVITIAEDRLANNPMDRDALLFAGYSRFFLAISRLSVEERNIDLDAAVRHLRLLKARGGTPHPERVDYILGKAYLLKGTYWADLAIYYLQASLDAGYKSEDSYEFIGRAYSQLGDIESALKWYELAAESHPTDRLLITLGEEAFKLGHYDDAAEYYRLSIDGTKDESLKKRGLSQLGQLYYDVGNYTMARGVLESLVSMEPDNQDYQFLLGETYHELGMDREARSTWFIVTRINPRHVGALHRLYD
jgi:tetratricopeptide (TPR) repeat protein